MAKKEETPEEKKAYFWNKKGQNFAGCKFGEDVTKWFVGDNTDKERLQKYLDNGQIVTSEPIDFDHAKENELNALRSKVEKLDSRNKELEEKARKGGSAKAREAKEKIKDLEKSLKESIQTIIDLETQLEEATKPGGK